MKSQILSPSKSILALVIMSMLVVMAACASTPTPSNPPPTTIIKSLPPTTFTSTPPTTSVQPSSSPAASYTVNISSKPSLGNFLVDSKGMTLYYFTKDNINKSTATGGTLTAWPLFNPASFVVPPSLNAADFGTITRDDGLKTATYKGWPLYYYIKDIAPGDVLGEGVGGVWFVIKVPFYTVMIQTKTDPGNYLVDAKGMALYYFAKDSVGKSTPIGSTLAAWPLFNPASIVVPSTMNPADFSTITRDDGMKVAAYKGWPLYYYIKDLAPGDTLGQGVGGVWFLIDPAKFPPVVATPTPTSISTPTLTPTPTPTPPTGGGGY